MLKNKTKQLESVLIRILTQKRKTLNVFFIRKNACYKIIYIQLKIIKSFFYFMLPLLEALSYEKRQVTLLGDFNMNGHNNTNRKVTQFDHEICAGLPISFI